MKIIFKITQFLIALLILVCGYMAFIYIGADINRLKTEYPKYDSKSKDYIYSTKSNDWSSLSQISYQAMWGIVISEDWAFFDHSGLDFNQLQIVLLESLEEKKLVRGASTISQQVVKNIFLSNERSLIRKFKEWIITYKLEQKLTKNKILEIYLNSIEFGENLYGIKAASRFYFNKSPANLNAREGAFLAMLLPSPKKYSISFRKNELTPFASEVIDNILLKLKQAKKITEEERINFLSSKFDWELKKGDMP